MNRLYKMLKDNAVEEYDYMVMSPQIFKEKGEWKLKFPYEYEPITFKDIKMMLEESNKVVVKMINELLVADLIELRDVIINDEQYTKVMFIKGGPK